MSEITQKWATQSHGEYLYIRQRVGTSGRPDFEKKWMDWRTPTPNTDGEYPMIFQCTEN
jgi:hypothetical protein